MRADRVKPGMLVRVLDSWYPLLEKTPVAGAPDMVRLRLAGISPVMSINRCLADDVETVRLTDPQVNALRNVAEHAVRLSSRAGGKPRWKMNSFWQPLPASPYDRVRELGLIREKGGTEVASYNTRRDFEITPSGRALLDILDKEKA